MSTTFNRIVSLFKGEHVIVFITKDKEQTKLVDLVGARDEQRRFDSFRLREQPTSTSTPTSNIDNRIRLRTDGIRL